MLSGDSAGKGKEKMALTINTNISSLIAQANLNSATNALNTSIERMTTGYKINHAKDNAAGFSIMKNWEIQLSSLDIAADNTATGIDLLTTLEDTYGLLTSHLQRVRDLTEQAANGTYGSASKDAIEAEITARLDEIERIAANAEFNGIDLMAGTVTNPLNLQVGIESNGNSQIALATTLFSKNDIATLFAAAPVKAVDTVAKACSGKDETNTAASMLTAIDKVMATINGKVTDIGSAQNRLESASDAIAVQSENITSSLSTIRDADIAEESSSYIKAQILQQAAATLLSTANQTPSIALSLI